MGRNRLPARAGALVLAVELEGEGALARSLLPVVDLGSEMGDGQVAQAVVVDRRVEEVGGHGGVHGQAT